MTKDEKLSIYNLLKTVSAYCNGYTSEAFAGAEPDFADDAEPASSDAFPQSLQEQPNNFSPVEASGSAPSQPPAAKPASLPALAAQIAECTACPLAATRTNTVPGMGVAKPYVLVVGEGPGQDEDLSGLPFVGAAGKLLDKMLAAIQLNRNSNCYIANVVKCRPPQNRTPTHEESQTCGGFLKAQIELLQPQMILAAGRTAAQYLLQTDAPLGSLRGTFHAYSASYANIPLLVTYHPSALLRDESNKRPAWEDLKMFRARLQEIVPNYAENA